MLRKIVGIVCSSLVLFSAFSANAGEPIPENEFEIPQGAYTARFVEDRSHVSIIEFSGNYDKTLVDDSFNAAARAVVAQEFYANHADSYDFLVVFSSFEYDTGDAVAFHLGVSNDIQGIGLPQFDNSALFGSNGKLQSYVDMAALSRYEVNPIRPEFDNTLGILAHEVLHRWGSHVRYLDDQGVVRDDLLGRDNAHWNFFLDSNASVEYGHDWQDNGDGTFSAVAARKFYSPLDLYLMGFYNKDQVPAMSLLQSNTTEFSRFAIPSPGARVDATTETITIDQIVSHEGARVPASSDAQKEFRFAFIYLKGAGESVSDRTLLNLNDVRRAFADRFAILTGGQGIAQIYPESLPAADLGTVDPLQTSDAISTDPITVNDAFAWLRTEQNAEGYWQDKSATTIRDTAVVLAALEDLDVNFNLGLQARTWLREQVATNNDSLSRQYFVTGDATLRDEVLAAQNSDGGWGLSVELQSNPLDTAIAIKALNKWTGNPLSVQGSALLNGLNYLTTHAKAAGGWPLVVDGPVDLRTTLTTLDSLRASNINHPSVDAAISWLATQQNGVGSFGASGGSIHETSQALLAFLAAEQSGLIDVTAAVQYIEERQRNGGHWEGSVYTTAIAVQALQSVALPNLVVQSITPEKISISDGERIKLSVMVSNDSSLTPPPTIAQFYLGDPASGGLPLGSPINLIGIPANTSVIGDFYWDTLDLAGDQTIFVVVDPANTIQERNEKDNVNSLDLTVASAPANVELEINSSEVLATPQFPSVLPTQTALSATVRNLGLVAAQNVVIELMQTNGSTNSATTQQIDIPARGSVVVNFVVNVVAPGVTTLSVNADSTNIFSEVNEANNLASVQVSTQDSVDLGIALADIDLGATATLHQDLTVPVVIRNNGTLTSPNTPIRFSVVGDGGTTVLQTVSAVIDAGQTQQYDIVWRPDLVGTVNFLVEIDPDNLVAELNEDNNLVSQAVSVQAGQGANIALSFRDLSFTPTPALEGLGVSLNGVVYNSGTQALSSVELAFFDGNPTAGGVQLGNLIIVPSLAPGEQVAVSAVWPNVVGNTERIIYLQADPNGLIAELDETDNLVFTQLPVRSLSELTSSAANIITNPGFPKQNQSVEITLDINNSGNQQADNVLVRLIQDGTEIGSGMTIPSIPGNGSAIATFTTSFASAGNHDLQVIIDPDNTVDESDETNNTVSRVLAVQDGSFYVTERYISPDGNGIKDSTEYFFRLNKAEDLSVYILDTRDRLVRSFENQFQNTATGSIAWDGRNKQGVLAPDGDYRFVVRTGSGVQLGETYITVDTNRSPLSDAIDTPFGLVQNLSCSIGEIQEYLPTGGWGYGRYWGLNSGSTNYKGNHPGLIYSADEEFIYFATYLQPFTVDGVLYQTNDRVRHPSGLYRSLNNATQVTRLLSDGFEYSPGEIFDIREIREIIPSQDGSQLAVLLVGRNSSSEYFAKILLMSNTGANVTQLWGKVYSTNRQVIRGMQFVADDTAIVFTTGEGDRDINQSITVVPTNGLTAATEYGLGTQNYRYNNRPAIEQAELSINQQSSHALIHLPEYQYDFSSSSSGDIEREQSSLYLFSLQTNQVTLIGSEVTAVSWSPNGQLFAVGDLSSDDLLIYNTSGAIHQRIPLPKQILDESLRQDLQVFFDFDLNQGMWGRLSEFSWNPDGTQFAFVLEDYFHSAYSGLAFESYYDDDEENDFEIEVEFFNGDSDVENLLGAALDSQFDLIGGIYFADVELSEVRKISEIIPTNFVDCYKGPCGGGGVEVGDFFETVPQVGGGLLDYDKVSIALRSGLPIVPWAEFEWFSEELVGRTRKIEWLNGGSEILVSGGSEGYYGSGLRISTPILLSVIYPAEETQFVFEDKKFNNYNTDNEIQSSSLGRLLTLSVTNDQSACINLPNEYHQFQSLLNLSLDLKAVRSGSSGGVILRGTAADKHFASYILEYASVTDPNSWQAIMPRSTDLVIDDQFTVWVAPQLGNYYVRLTGTDLAGNTRAAIKQVSVTENASIANVYRQQANFSPNGDGVKDTTSVHFRILQPVNLQFEVLNSVGETVRSYQQPFDIIGQETDLVWDGRNQNGIVAADGRYTLKLQNYEFFVNLDNTPPTITNTTKPLLVDHFTEQNECVQTKESICLIALDLRQSFYAQDEGSLPDLRLQAREQGQSQWLEVAIITETMVGDENTDIVTSAKNFSYNELAVGDYRVVAKDLSGNISIVQIAPQLKQGQIYVQRAGRDELPTTQELGSRYRAYPDILRNLPTQPNRAPDSQFSDPTILDSFGTLRFTIAETIGEPLQAIEILYRPYATSDPDIISTTIGSEFLSSSVINYLAPTKCLQLGISTGAFACRNILDADIDERNDGQFEFIWDPESSGLANDVNHELVVKATTESGLVIYSNHLFLKPDVVFYDLSNAAVKRDKNDADQPTYRVGMDSSLSLITNQPPVGVAEYQLHITTHSISTAPDNRFLTSTLIDTIYPDGNNQISGFQPDFELFAHEYWFDVSPLEDCRAYSARLQVLGVDGSQFSVTSLLETSCFEIVAEPYPIVAEACDAPATHTVRIPLTSNFLGSGSQVDELPLLRLELATEGQTPGVYDNILFNQNDPAYGQEYSFDLDITVYAGQGELTLQARAIDIQGSVTTKLIQIPIVLSAPVVSIQSPLVGQKVCANTFAATSYVETPNQLGDAYFGLSIQGSVISEGDTYYEIINSDNGLKEFCSQSETLLRDRLCLDGVIDTKEKEENLKKRFKSMVDGVDVSGLGGNLQISRFRFNPVTNQMEVNGDLAFPKVQGVGVRQLELHAYNWSGAKACAIREFEIDAEVEGFSISASSPTLFSPNGDGNLDSIDITASIDESAAFTLEVYSTTLDGQGVYLDNQLMVTPILDLNVLAGASLLNWNGFDAGGTPLADGIYRVYVSAVDGCGLEAKQGFLIEIDNTSPIAAITYPIDGDPVGIIIEVIGSASDKNLIQYSLEIVDGTQTIPLSVGSTNIQSDALGSWNTFGLDGSYILRLSANDEAGNVSFIEEPLTLPLRQALISDHGLIEKYVSPNGDAKLDAAVVRTSFERDVIATFAVLSNDVPVRTLSDQVAYSAGSVSINWDGLDDNGVLVADGSYIIRVNAADPQVAGFNQSESATVIVDTQAPDVVLRDYVDGFIENFGSLSVIGSINDLHFDNYYIEILSGPGSLGGVRLIESNQLPNNPSLIDFDALQFSVEGIYEIAFIAEDFAKNITRLQAKFLVDTTAPKITITSPSEGDAFNLASSPVSIEGEIDEEFLKVYRVTATSPVNPNNVIVIIEQNTLPVSTTLANWDLSGVAEGDYLLSVFAQDRTGQSTTESITLAVDNTAPTVEISFPVEGGFLTKLAAIQGAVNDEHFRQYSLAISSGHVGSEGGYSNLIINNQAVANGILLDWSALPAEGVHTLRLVAEDVAGNKNTIYRHYAVDTLPPAAPVLDAVTLDRQNLAITVDWLNSPESDLDGYRVYRNGVAINADLVIAISTQDLNVVEGNYTYTITAVDFAGNESPQSNAIDIRVDLTPPTTFLSSPSNNGVVSGLVNIRGTAHSETDFKSYRVYVGAQNSPLQLVKDSAVPLLGNELAQWETLGLSESTLYTIRLEAEDVEGNIATQEILVRLDNTPPDAPTNLQSFVSENDVGPFWEFSGDQSDLAGYLLFRNGKLVNADGNTIGDLTPFVLQELEYVDLDLYDGEYTYTVFAIDDAGNISAPSNDEIVTLDNNIPHSVIVSIADGENFENEIYLLTEQSDLDIAQVVFEYRAANTSNWLSVATILGEAPYEFLWDTQTLAYGDYELRAVATDVNNNADGAPVALVVHKVDLTPPNIVQNFLISTTGDSVQLAWDANTDIDFSHYGVYRKLENDSLWSPLNISVANNSYTDIVADDAVYDYQILAFDNVGNTSDPVSDQTIVFSLIIRESYTPTLSATADLRAQTIPNAQIEAEVVNSGGSTQLNGVVSDAQGEITFATINLADGDNQLNVQVIHTDYDSVSRLASYSIYKGTAPSKIIGVSATYDVTGNDVDLQWNANPIGEQVVGYRLYRDDVSITPIINAPVLSAFADQNPFAVSSLIDSSIFSSWFFDTLSSLDTSFGVNLVSRQWIHKMEVNFRTTSIQVTDYEIYAWDGSQWAFIQSIHFEEEEFANIQVLNLDSPYYTDRIRVKPIAATRSFVRIYDFNVYAYDLIENTNTFDIPLNGVREYQLSAVNDLGFEGALSDKATVAFGDVIAPMPVSLNVVVVNSTVDLSWTESVSSDRNLYRIYRDGVVMREQNTTATRSHVDGPLKNGTYLYSVRVVDSDGNESVDSNVASAVVAVALLPAPINASAASIAPHGNVELTWNPGLNSSPAGYRVFRSTVSGSGFVQVGESTTNSFIDETVQLGTAYFYHVRALDILGNPSAPSNEANVTAEDIVGPDAPKIVSPTASGVVFETSKAFVDISGVAEEGSVAYLVGQGTTGIGGVEVTGEFETLSETATDLYAIQISDIGTLAFLERAGFEYTLKVVDGSFERVLVNSGQDQEFVDDFIWIGSQLFVSIYSDVTGQSVMYQFDIETGTRSIVDGLAFGGDVYVRFLSYDESSNRLFFTVDDDSGGFGSGTFSFNVSTGEKVDLTTRRYDYVSGDFSKLVFSFYSSGNVNTEIFDIASGSVNIVSTPSGNPAGLSNLSTGGLKTVLSLPNTNGTGRDLQLVDYENDISRTLASAVDLTSNSILWASDQQIIYTLIDGVTGQANLVQQDIVSDEVTILKVYGQGVVPYLLENGLTDDGRIIIKISDDVGQRWTENLLPGVFKFLNVPLASGDNIFSVFAVDSGENIGLDSLPIVVSRVEESLPDLQATIEFSPAIGVINQDAGIRINVSNSGSIIAEQAQYSLVVLDSFGSQTVITQNATLPSLAAGLSTIQNHTWRPTASGTYTFVLSLDSGGLIREQSESNNVVIAELQVAVEGVPLVGLTLDRSQARTFLFEPNEILNGDVEFVNATNSFSGNLELAVVDSAGFEVILLSRKTFTSAPFNHRLNIPFQWSANGIFAGNYAVVVRLLDASGIQIGEKRAPFTINANLHLVSSLLTGQSAYGPHENVTITSNILNQGGNLSFSDGTAAVVVTNNLGVVVYANSQAIGELLPGEGSGFTENWNTAANSVGLYSATLTVLSNTGDTLSTSNAEFTILAGQPSFVGSLTMPNNRFASGSLITTNYMVESQTNTAVSEVNISVELFDPDSNTGIDSLSLAMNFTPSQIVSNPVQFDSSSIAIKSYQIILVSTVVVNGNTFRQELDRKSVSIFDGSPPDVTIEEPSDQQVLNWNTKTLSVRAIDADSGVESAEGRFDGAGWLNLPGDAIDAQLFLSRLPVLSDGPHIVEVRASDTLGNTSNIISANFIVDTLAPQIVINNIENGLFYSIAVSPTVTVSDLHLESTEILLDGEVYVSGTSIDTEGQHMLSVIAIDVAGNLSREVILFAIDFTGALIDIGGVSDQGIYNHPVIPIVTIVDDNAVTANVLLNGVSFVAGSEVSVEGTYVLSVEVTDVAGNISTAIVNFAIDLTPPPAPTVTSHSDGDQIHEELITFVGLSEPDAIINLVDGNGLTYSVITNMSGIFSIANLQLQDGTNDLSLTATDKAGNLGSATSLSLILQPNTATDVVGELAPLNSRVLIWLPSKDIAAHPHCWLHSHSGHHNHYSHYGHDEESLYEDIVDSLSSQNIEFFVARNERDFMRELRSQKYNTLLLARLSRVRHFDDVISGGSLLEIRAMVAAGTGLIVINTERSAIPMLRDVIGAKITRPIRYSGTLNLDDSIATQSGSWDLSDTRAVGVQLKGGRAVGSISYNCWKRSSQCSQPAIVLNRYGEGDVAFLSFNPAAIEDHDQGNQLLIDLVNFAKPDSSEVFAGTPVELEWTAGPLQPPKDLLFTQTLPQELEHEHVFDGDIISSTQALWTRHIQTSEFTDFGSLIALPDVSGSYVIHSELFSGDENASTTIGSGQITVDLGSSVGDMEQDLIDALVQARSDASFRKRGLYSLALHYVRKAVVADRESHFQSRIALFNLQLAVFKLQLTGDTELVAEVGQLLEIYQYAWFKTLN